MKKSRRQKGFTLMELMVVIVIVAILAAVAVPLYINYVKDAKRTEAKGAIAAILTSEQVFYQENGVYKIDDVTNPQFLKVELDQSLTTNWQFKISGADANGFTVDASGIGNDNKGLDVMLVYTRTGGPTWTDK